MTTLHFGSRFKGAAVALSVAAALTSVATTANAAHVGIKTLDQLLVAGASFTVGDKTFSDFTYTSTGLSTTAAGITVTFDDNIGGNIGLTIDGKWKLDNGTGLVDLLGSADLDYKVTVTAPGFYITDFHLDGDLVVSGTGASGTVAMTPRDAQNTVIPTTLVGPGTLPLTISNGVPFGYVPNASSLVNAPNKPTVAFMHTDIELTAKAGSSVSFSQPVPEPSSYAMLIAGLACVGTVMRRRNTTKA